MQIDHDHLCWNCRYNLRGLESTGECPECGEPINLKRKPVSEGNRLFAFAAALILIFLIVVTILLDVLLAATAMPSYGLVVASIASFVAVPTWLTTRNGGVFRCFVILMILLCVLPFIPTSPDNPHLRFFKRIRRGMTQEEVISKLDICFPNRIQENRPQITRREPDLMCIVRDPNDGRYNAEVIYTEFQNGRLFSKSWSPD